MSYSDVSLMIDGAWTKGANGRTIPAQTFLDVQFSVELLRGLKLTGGALNALNHEPHFAEVNGIQGYDTSQGDLKGRFWYLRLGKTF